MTVPNFNFSKASPTTSTTNANTTSTTNTIPTTNIIPTTDAPSNNTFNRGNKLDNSERTKRFSKSLLSLGRSGDSSSKIWPGSVTPSEASLSTSATVHATEKSNSADKRDLLGLLEKYDVAAADTDVDLLEEKIKRFQVRLQTPEDESNTQKTETAEAEDVSSDLMHNTHRKESSEQLVDLTDEIHSTNLDTLDVEGKNLEPGQGIFNQERSTLRSVSPKPVAIMPLQLYDVNLPYENAENKSSTLHTEIQEPVQKNSQSAKRHETLSRAGNHVDPREQYQLSHKPFDFNTFLNHLKSKGAEPIVRYTKSFLTSFTRQADNMGTKQMMKAVEDFKAFVDERFKEHTPFASMDEKDLENLREGIEKLIMNCLYDVCFAPLAFRRYDINSPTFVIEDLDADNKFSLQVEKYSWVLGVHLDVDLDQLIAQRKSKTKDTIDYMDHAREQLNKINEYRAPRDKIICVLNACKVIFSLLKATKYETNADSFIPLLILVILKAKTPNFISNIRFILRFRGSTWLNHGETSYYLSTIEAAVIFIQDIKFDNLTIVESHYNAHMEAWDASLRQENVQILRPLPQRLPDPESRTAFSMSPSNVLLTSAGIIGKSLSSFLSLSPSSEPLEETPVSPAPPAVSETQIEETFNRLSEVFPILDKSILRDVIIMNDGDIERALEVCLQLVNE